MPCVRARGLGEGLELRLAIALDPQFPLGLVAAALTDLHDTYPSVALWMWTAPLRAAIVALCEGRCTLAITAADIADPRIELEALTFVPRAAVAAATHPLAIRSGSGAACGGRAGRPPPDRGPGPISTHRGSRLRGAVARDMAGKRQRDEARPDPRRRRLGSLLLWLVERDLAEGRLVRVAAAEFGQQGETFVRAYLAHRTDPSLLALRHACCVRRRRVDGSGATAPEALSS